MRMPTVTRFPLQLERDARILRVGAIGDRGERWGAVRIRHRPGERLRAGERAVGHRHGDEVRPGARIRERAGEQRILTEGDTYVVPAATAHGIRVLEQRTQIVEVAKA